MPVCMLLGAMEPTDASHCQSSKLANTALAECQTHMLRLAVLEVASWHGITALHGRNEPDLGIESANVLQPQATWKFPSAGPEIIKTCQLDCRSGIHCGRCRSPNSTWRHLTIYQPRGNDASAPSLVTFQSTSTCLAWAGNVCIVCPA